MNWTEILTSVLGIVATGIVSLLGVLLTRWLSKSAKTEKEKQTINDLATLITNAITYFNQTAVETLKKENKFDDVAKEAIKQKCLEYVNGKLSEDMKAYLKTHNQDISDLIEVYVNKLK